MAEETTPQLLLVLREVVTCVSVAAMVFGGVAPYVPQYITIRRSRDAGGFSTYVCLVLLVANILRVYFWFGVRYELPLLFQSLLMITTMLAMVHLCVRVRREMEIDDHPHRIWDMNFQYFWQWTQFNDYIVFILILWFVIGTISVLFMSVKLYVELLGFTSLMTEASLGLPQFWRNFKQRSTSGMSVAMVTMWLCGDVFKTLYFLVRHSPLQFSVCGCVQVMVDIAILLQVALYKRTSTN